MNCLPMYFKNEVGFTKKDWIFAPTLNLREIQKPYIFDFTEKISDHALYVSHFKTEVDFTKNGYFATTLNSHKIQRVDFT